MTDEHKIFFHLAAALAIGLLIGLERGWSQRETPEGRRIAGVRTFGLVGLTGGAAALLAGQFGGQFGGIAFGLAFLGLAGLFAASYAVTIDEEHNLSITSEIAALLTFVLGALAASGRPSIAVAAAVATTLLLSYKPLLHGWVRALDEDELHAGLKLLLMSAVVLPVLPDQGYGPGNALNPYQIWWMVVLVAAISFVGYFAVRIGGARRGVLFTGLFGGLASSTAVTLNFSRLAATDGQADNVRVLAIGILIACGTMFPRLLVLAAATNPGLLPSLLPVVLVMAAFIYLPALYFWRLEAPDEGGAATPLRNPLDLQMAIGFGALLAVVLALARLLKDQFGSAGVYVLAAFSGISDVDAITLSLAGMSALDLAASTAIAGIVIAAAVNNLTKTGIALFIGGRRIGLYVGVPLVASALAGLALVWYLLS